MKDFDFTETNRPKQNQLKHHRSWRVFFGNVASSEENVKERLRDQKNPATIWNTTFDVE
ncbi:hypothetical protein LBMAG52_41270 [Planctomycetia bacterium]|nr:hypothetical protein LBMAG52_41270 [Planctomycetia bacterium]